MARRAFGLNRDRVVFRVEGNRPVRLLDADFLPLPDETSPPLQAVFDRSVDRLKTIEGVEPPPVGSRRSRGP